MPVLVGADNPNWKGGNVELRCLECGARFSVKPLRANSARFCSLPCANKHMARHPRNTGRRRWTAVTCPNCGRQFEIRISWVNRKKFCTQKCGLAWRGVRFSGSGNPNWVGGISRLPYPLEFTTISRRLIEKSGGVCSNPQCDRPSKRMTTHHINYDKMDCRDENLIAVCARCNSRANFNREHWQRFYSDLVRLEHGNFDVKPIG